MSRQYGDPNINSLMEYMEQANGGMMDGSVAMNRRYCRTMIQRMRKWFPEHEGQEYRLLKHLIDIAKADPFHSPNTTNFRYLIDHGAKIIKKSKERKSHGREQYSAAMADAAARIIIERREYSAAREQGGGVGRDDVPHDKGRDGRADDRAGRQGGGR